MQWLVASNRLDPRHLADRTAHCVHRPAVLCAVRDRTPELEHGAMWENQHIRLLPLRTQQAVSCPVIGAV